MLEEYKNVGSLIFHRILLLTVGLIAVIFFRGWGMSGFIVLVVIYSRVLANKRGVEYFPDRLKSSAGTLYGIGLVVLFVLLILGMVAANFFENELRPLSATLNALSVIDSVPSCSETPTLHDRRFYNCYTFYWGISIMSLLFPLLVTLTLGDVVNFARLRVRIGKWILLVSIISLIVLVVPLSIPTKISGTGFYDFMFRISHFSMFFLLPLISNRIAY